MRGLRFCYWRLDNFLIFGRFQVTLEEVYWIYCFILEIYFVMQMGRHGNPCIAHIANDLSSFHKITGFHRKLLEMSIACFKTEPVINKDNIAVGA